VTQTDSQRDVVDLLSADHREFDRIFTELEGLFGQTGPDVLRRKRELVDEVTIGLVKHSVAEETRVYPASRTRSTARRPSTPSTSTPRPRRP
jgi:hypothetical protein